MGLYEFVSDRYAYLFITQNIGRITGNKSKFFRPDLSVVHNMGIGSLANVDIHQGLDFRTMEHGYFESGVVVSNLVRFNYLDLLYLGLGAGGFYRYGQNALASTADNFIGKVVVTFSF